MSTSRSLGVRKPSLGRCLPAALCTTLRWALATSQVNGSVRPWAQQGSWRLRLICACSPFSGIGEPDAGDIHVTFVLSAESTGYP